VQRALAAQDWPGGARVRVRIGIHTGQAVPQEGRYTGLAVHRAARICAAAAGGQVLVSQALIEDEEEGDDLGFTLVDVGEHRLKDLDRPVRLFQLAAAGLDMPSPGGPAAALAFGETGPGPADRAAAGVHGLPAALTSFIGRDQPIRRVTELLEQHRLVTVTGPGGSGKTRLAGEVSGRVAGRFADGTWLAELATVQDPALVASVVATALGIRDLPGTSAAEALVRALARRQLLLVLDNCEHVIDMAAELCAALLATADDVTILATSREPLAVTGEARYRLAPMALPDPGDLAGVARAEAVALFADRARSADARFVLDEQTGPAVARLVTRLDGMPLAIELAAARVEALGLAQLLDRIDDRCALLATPQRTAPSRQRSLAATVQWSYELLDETQQRVFRAVSVFPGPFTLEAAEAIAGEGAGPVVLRLVDCSLLVPPQPGQDGRSRYSMLKTLRAYGTRLLVQAGEQDAADVALAEYALAVAGQAGAGLATGTTEEVVAGHWLDAEDAMMRQVLAWASEHDTAIALRLGVALAPWWRLRGRAPGGYPLLRAAADRSVPGESAWCEAQFWLGQITLSSGDLTTSLHHFTVVTDAIADRGPSRPLALCLGGRSVTLSNLGRVTEALDQARRSLAMAEELGYPDGQALALADLAIATSYAGDPDGAVGFIRQAKQIPGQRGWLTRMSDYLLTSMLIDAGDTAAAERVCVAALALNREVGDQSYLAALPRLMADLDLRAGRTGDAARHLREALQVIQRTGAGFELGDVLEICGYLCAATRRPAEAVTLLAASEVLSAASLAEFAENLPWVHRRREALRQAREVLGPDAARAAGERGAAMSLAIAAEYVLLVTASAQAAGPSEARPAQLSAGERELVTLVAWGRTDAEIAAQLQSSIRTVRSRLDQVRDKTGCRRRADLTRLALQADLV
jgi:predicted ATPase/DNA-binding CsgD family transcriptional regulator